MFDGSDLFGMAVILGISMVTGVIGMVSGAGYI